MSLTMSHFTAWFGGFVLFFFNFVFSSNLDTILIRNIIEQYFNFFMVPVSQALVAVTIIKDWVSLTEVEHQKTWHHKTHVLLFVSQESQTSGALESA